MNELKTRYGKLDIWIECLQAWKTKSETKVTAPTFFLADDDVISALVAAGAFIKLVVKPSLFANEDDTDDDGILVTFVFAPLLLLLLLWLLWLRDTFIGGFFLMIFPASFDAISMV